MVYDEVVGYDVDRKQSNTGIKVCNLLNESKPDGHVILSTLDKLIQFLGGRVKIDLSHLKVLVIDEADVFFERLQSQEALMKLHSIL